MGVTKEDTRQFVLKMMDALFRLDKNSVIEWVNTVWPHNMGVTEDKAHPENRQLTL